MSHLQNSASAWGLQNLAGDCWGQGSHPAEDECCHWQAQLDTTEPGPEGELEGCSLLAPALRESLLHLASSFEEKQHKVRPHWQSGFQFLQIYTD